MATMDKTTFNTRNDIAPEIRASMVELLNQQLANLTDLYSQTKQAHWNVKGIHFIELHNLFDQVAHMIEPYIDTVAERATALGGYARGTTRMAADETILPEWPTDITQGEDMVQAAANRWADVAAAMRDAIDKADSAGDMDTADLFTGISRELDKGLWFIEAHLQPRD